jgi:para-nitrobenzyl esterase
MKSRIWRLALAAALLCGAVPRPCVATEADPLLVNTESGPVLGQLSADGAARYWLGIPYAAPPVGELRWKAARPPAPWTEVLKAQAYGAPCAQIGSIYGPPAPGKAWGPDNVENYGKPVGSEDCLTLNVWRPSTTEQRLPVIVFIHGGSGVVGYSGDPCYDGAHLAVGANVVVITINYRLGLFGALLHPALADGNALDDSGNYAALDFIQALRFIQANAAAFGADPGNVTLMGQSAGAIAVYSMMASGLSEGLFHKAIALSGLIGGGKKADGYKYSDRLAAELVIADGLAAMPDQAKAYLAAKDAAWLQRYLRSKTAQQLLQLQARLPVLRRVPGGFNDGVVMPVDVDAVWDQGRFHHVPIIIGRTRDEAKLFTSKLMRVNDAQRFGMMLDSDPDAPPKYRLDQLLSPWLLPWLTSGLYDAYAWGMMALLGHPLNQAITKPARYQSQVWAYRFDWDRGPEPWRTLYGAAHGLDLPFVFGNFSKNFFAVDFSRQNQPGREALSRLMIHAIAAFVRTGDPNVPELGMQWPAWSAQGEQRRLVFDASDQIPQLSVR